MKTEAKSLKTIKRVGNAPCLDFVNTLYSHLMPDPYDYIATYDALVEWANGGGLVDRTTRQRLADEARRHPRQSARAHRRAIELRGYLYRIFLALTRGEKPPPRDLKVLNGWLREVFDKREIALKDGRFQWTMADADSFERPLWPIVLSAGEVLVSGLHERVKECPAEDCGWLFLDTSKNGKRKWCLMETCGNVAKARRYYDRHMRG